MLVFYPTILAISGWVHAIDIVVHRLICAAGMHII